MATKINFDTTDIHIAARKETCVQNNVEVQSLGARRADISLIFADPYESGEILEADAIVDFFKACRGRLKNGGSVAVPCNLRTLTKISKSLEDAGFKQLRFVQVVSESSEKRFYPEKSRTMMLLAVKGGGSTFNSIYNNGHYPRPEVTNKGTPLLPATECPLKFLVAEIVSVHSNPGDVIATTSNTVLAKLSDLSSVGAIEYRIKPAKPPKQTKAKTENFA
jgi:hypothetical protein